MQTFFILSNFLQNFGQFEAQRWSFNVLKLKTGSGKNLEVETRERKLFFSSEKFVWQKKLVTSFNDKQNYLHLEQQSETMGIFIAEITTALTAAEVGLR